MGEFYALLTAVLWAAAVIFLKRSGEDIPPFALNLFRIALSTVALAITMLAGGQSLFLSMPLRDYLVLFASGIVAIAISDTLFLMALNRVGAGIMAIVDCLYSPFVIFFAFVMLREQLGLFQYGGMAMVILGVAMASRHKPPQGVTVGRIVEGVFLGVAAMATVAFGIVLAKPVIMRSPILWATTMRQVGALAAMVPAALVLPGRRALFSHFLPSRSWVHSVPATMLGSYLALIFWIAGMKYSLAGAAAILNQTSSVYILIFASIFLGEPFTVRKALATALAIAGIAMVTFG